MPIHTKRPVAIAQVAREPLTSATTVRQKLELLVNIPDAGIPRRCVMWAIVRGIQKSIHWLNVSISSLEIGGSSAVIPLAFLALFLAGDLLAFLAPPDSVSTVPVRMIVTTAGLHGGKPAEIKMQDVQVYQ